MNITDRNSKCPPFFQKCDSNFREKIVVIKDLCADELSAIDASRYILGDSLDTKIKVNATIDHKLLYVVRRIGFRIAVPSQQSLKNPLL